ncbi:MAG TPA: patatin-like phospholipase family protein [Dehalococcoidia bacterium]|nr:patatin-like phospholipase family protein [Dehalococcoidia bacterium]
MVGRALVLGGGGTVGIAWLTGMVRGLQEGGVDVTRADLFVGTSAGACVGMRLAHGDTPHALFTEQLSVESAFIDQVRTVLAQMDTQAMMQLFGLWTGVAEVNEAALAQIGALALAAKTAPEESFIDTISLYTTPRGWPSRRLIVTAVDCSSGALASWDVQSGVPAERAVASSCAVPGMFPPIMINHRRYMDGGVRSGSNADLAGGSERVLAIAPIGGGQDPLSALGRRAAEAEAARLRAAGAQVELVFPDAEALAAFGPNLMALDRGPLAANAGLRQGRALAPRVAGLWGI